ncbi:DUF1748 domain containing protein [Rutstroemia sp. NJR-2017a BVV2]|nr:DUF1748 domain containing protein [Rutstroemia sp. NJR-2017a BVV2]
MVHPLYLIFGLLFLQKSTKPNRAAQLLNLLTFGLWGKLGRLTHYAFDAVLRKIHPLCDGGMTIVLTSLPNSIRLLGRNEKIHWLNRCGAKTTSKTTKANNSQSSGALDLDSLTENKDINAWIEKYLGVGEWVMDQSVAIAGSSGWFERKR